MLHFLRLFQIFPLSFWHLVELVKPHPNMETLIYQWELVGLQLERVQLFTWIHSTNKGQVPRRLNQLHTIKQGVQSESKNPTVTSLGKFWYLLQKSADFHLLLPLKYPFLLLCKFQLKLHLFLVLFLSWESVSLGHLLLLFGLFSFLNIQSSLRTPGGLCTKVNPTSMQTITSGISPRWTTYSIVLTPNQHNMLAHTVYLFECRQLSFVTVEPTER